MKTEVVEKYGGYKILRPERKYRLICITFTSYQPKNKGNLLYWKLSYAKSVYMYPNPKNTSWSFKTYQHINYLYLGLEIPTDKLPLHWSRDGSLYDIDHQLVMTRNDIDSKIAMEILSLS